MVFSQKKIKIKGVVLDKNNVGIGFVNVYFKDDIEGTLTDMDGKFELISEIENQKELIFSSIGYETKIKVINEDFEDLFLEVVLSDAVGMLEEIVISSNSYTSGKNKGVTLSALDVLKTPGAAGDIFLAIQTYPGVSQVEEGAGLFVRGGENAETVTLLDGAYMFNPFKFSTPTGGFFGTISPFSTKSSYFSPGGFSVEYGNSISGVLSLKSKDIPIIESYNLSLGLANSGFEVEKPSKNGKFGFSIIGNYSDTEALFLFNKSSKEFKKYPVSRDISTILNYLPNSNSSFKFFGLIRDDQVGVNIINPLTTADFLGNNIQGFYNVSYRYSIANLLLKSNISYSNYQSETKIYFDIDEYSSFDLKSRKDDNIFQLSTSVQFKFSNKLMGELGVGVINLKDNVDGEFLLSTINGSGIVESGQPIFSRVRYNSRRNIAYNNWNYKFNKNNIILLGTRYEKDSQSGQSYINFRGTYDSKLSDNLNIYGSIGNYSQYASSDFYDLNNGNPKLGFLEADHYIIGLSSVKKSRVFKLDFFYKNYRNLILNDPIKNYTNDGFGFSKGIELFYKNNLKKLETRFSLSYLDTERKWGNAPNLAPTTYDIPWNFTALFNYPISDYISTALKYKYASGKPYTNGSEVSNYNSQRIPDYHRVDFSLNYNMNISDRNNLTIYLSVNNILNNKILIDYEYSSDYSKRLEREETFRRNFYFGVQYNFQKL